MERFIRGGIAAAVLGGLLLATGASLMLAPAGDQQFSDMAATGIFTVAAALRFTGVMLMTWGVISLYLAQADRAGRLGLIAVVACLASMALQTGWIFCDLFAAPSFAHAAPQVLNDPSGPLMVGLIAAWLARASFILLGIASLRARVLPKTSGFALIAAGAITLVPLPGGDQAVYEVIIGIAFAVAAARALTASTRAPLPAQSAT
jgi:hypothetical protein